MSLQPGSPPVDACIASIAATPESGQLVEVRRRQWVVADIVTSTPSNSYSPAQHLLTLSSIDEDSLGEQIEIVWEIEPGAHIIERAGFRRAAAKPRPISV